MGLSCLGKMLGHRRVVLPSLWVLLGLLVAGELTAHPIADADDAFKAGNYRQACLMYEALAELGYLYAKNQLQTPDCIATLKAVANVVDDKGDAEYLKGKTMFDSGAGYEKARAHLERAVEQGSGKAAFMLYKISNSEKWLDIAVKLGDDRALATIADTKQQEAAAADLGTNHATYISRLREKYKSRVRYSSVEAEQVIESFHIDCHSPNGNYLPLINVLYARLAAADSARMWLVTDVQRRGEDVRIVDTLMGKTGPLAQPAVAFEINKWGELQPIGIRAEAVLNACFGSYGPIWVVPGK
jgi:hypothetical protein